MAPAPKAAPPGPPRNRSHALIVDLKLDGAGESDGVLLALGSALGGFSLHVEYVFTKDEGLGGTGVLRCDEVARGVLPRFTPSGFSLVPAARPVSRWPAASASPAGHAARSGGPRRCRGASPRRR